MKRLPIISLLLFLLCGCEFEGSPNGELDGFWLLTHIDTLSNQHRFNCRDSLAFWAIQGDLLKTQQIAGKNSVYKYVFRFNYDGTRLDVFEPHQYERMNGNIPIEADRMHELQIFGINSEEESYTVEQLNRKEMKLKNEYLRLNFERY